MVAGQAAVDSIANPDTIFSDAGINLIKDRVDKLNAEEKKVTLSNGETLKYDKLVLSPGSTPIMPPVPGSDLEGVFTLRNSSDAEIIRNYLQERKPSKLVFIGAGFINLELAALLSEENPGKYDAAVVEMLDYPLPTMIDSEMGAKMHSFLNDQGFKLKFNQKAVELKGENGKVTGVVLDSGEVLDADMVMISVGTHPNLKLAEDAGLEIGNIGVKVNKYLETSNPHIFAGGDIIETQHFITKKPASSLLRGPAVIQGRLIAKKLAGYNIPFPGVLNNSAVRIFDKYICAVGLNEDQAEKEGFQAIGAVVDSSSKHKMIPGSKPWTLKLVFDKESQRLLGGQIISDDPAPAKEIDAVNALILGEKTAPQITTFMCAGNPDCSSEPSREPISLAAEQALHKINA